MRSAGYSPHTCKTITLRHGETHTETEWTGHHFLTQSCCQHVLMPKYITRLLLAKLPPPPSYRNFTRESGSDRGKWRAEEQSEEKVKTEKHWQLRGRRHGRGRTGGHVRGEDWETAADPVGTIGEDHVWGQTNSMTWKTAVLLLLLPHLLSSRNISAVRTAHIWKHLRVPLSSPSHLSKFHSHLLEQRNFREDLKWYSWRFDKSEWIRYFTFQLGRLTLFCFLLSWSI